MKALRHDVSPASPICMKKARLVIPNFGIALPGVGLAQGPYHNRFPGGHPII